MNDQEAREFLEEKLLQLELLPGSTVYIDETIFEDFLRNKSLISYHLIKFIEAGRLQAVTSALTLVQLMKWVEEDRKNLTLMYLTRVANMEYLPYGVTNVEELLLPGTNLLSLEEAVHISTAALYSKKSSVNCLPFITMDPARADIKINLVNLSYIGSP